MLCVPLSSSGGSSMTENTLSAAARPRCSDELTPVRCFNGVSSISVAVMNDTKLPTVTPLAPVCCVE